MHRFKTVYERKNRLGKRVFDYGCISIDSDSVKCDVLHGIHGDNLIVDKK